MSSKSTETLNIVKKYEKEYNDESNEDDVKEDLTPNKIEQQLDEKIPKYNKFNENHPMEYISYDKTTHRYDINTKTIRKKSYDLNEAINYTKKIILKENSNIFNEEKIIKKIISNKYCILIKYVYNKKIYYDVQHILCYLSLKKGSILDKYKNIKNNIAGYCWHPNQFGGFIKRELITIKTIKLLIKSTNTPSIINLMKLLNIDILKYKIPRKETTNLNKIIKVFSKEKITPQKYVGKYRIDLYFPDYKLGIECDEKDHAYENPKYKKERQKYIENNLNATFIRFNPDDPNFDIFEVISKIHYHMKNKTN